MSTQYHKLSDALRTPKQSPWTGKEVTIQFRVKDRGAWMRFDVTKDYVAAVVLPRFSKDRHYEFRIRP